MVLDGANQVGVFGQPTAVVPSVLVTDASNKPVPGVTVTFAVTPGSGSVRSSTATTDATGTATPGEWKLGNSFAAMALLVTVTGLPTVTFSARAIAPDAGVLAFTLTDPVGDTLPTALTTNPRAHDVLSVRGDFKRDSLILTLTFAAPVGASRTSTAPALVGFIELDIDESASTGSIPVSNTFGASAPLGIDYTIAIFGDGTAAVRAPGQAAIQATVPVTFADNSAVIHVPMQALGNDDGRFALVGVIGTFDRPTDIFPNAGPFSVRPSASIAGWWPAIDRVTRAPSEPRAPPP